MSNQSYVRHDENNNPVVPQPTTTPGTVDPGSGWTTQPYLNFNGDYERYDENNVIDVPQPTPNGGDYVRHDIDNNVAPVPQPYQRHDENNNPIT